MSVTVGTLTIDLKANTASFSGSMDKMSQLSAKTANDIKRSLEKIAAAGLAMGAAIATGTAALIIHSLDSADALYKLAQSAGTTTETLSVLNYAAGLSNVSSEELGKGLEKLSKSAFSAQNGNQALTNVFTRLKASAVDATGHLKDSGVLFGEIATRFAGMADGAGKTALAMTLFGKAGAGLIPLLNQYGAEQQKVNDEAHRFGLVISSSTAKVAAEAHDNLERLKLVFQGLGYSLLAATVPAISNLVDRLIGRVIPALTQFAGWLETSLWFIGQLAAEEGIASAAGYVLGGAQGFGHTFVGMEVGTPYLPAGPGSGGTHNVSPLSPQELGNTTNFWGFFTFGALQGDGYVPVQNPFGPACSFTGKSAAMLRLIYDPKIFNFGIPQIAFKLRGVNSVYDPRLGDFSNPATHIYTQNAALIIADFLTQPVRGFRLNYGTDIPLDKLAASANSCDEAVSLMSGLTEPRYRINGKFDLSRKRGEILTDLLSACAGRLTVQGGQYIIHVGVWPGDPTQTLSMDQLAGPIEWRPTSSIREHFNSCKGTFISPDAQYTSTDFPPYQEDGDHGFTDLITGDVLLTEDDNERRYMELHLPFTTSVSAAQRLAKIALLRSRYSGTGTFTLNASGASYSPCDLISATIPALGWTGKVLEVIAARLIVAENDGGIVIGASIDVRETDSSVYAWSTEEQLSPENFVISPFPRGIVIQPYAWPWSPGYAVPLDGDAMYPTGSKGLASFGLQPAYGVDGQGNASITLAIKGVPVINQLDFNVSAPWIICTPSLTGGNLVAGTYIVGLSAKDAGSGFSDSDYLANSLGPIQIDSGTTGSIAVDIRMGSGDDGGTFYLAKWNDTHEYVFHRNIDVTADASSAVLTDLDESQAGGPDPLMRTYGIVHQQVVHGGCWALQIHSLDATSLTFGADGMTLNQWQSYTVSLLARLDPTLEISFLNGLVASSTASSGDLFTLVIGPNSNGVSLPDLTTLLVPGDLILCRFHPTFTGTSFSDPNIANGVYLSGDTAIEAGHLAVCLTGVNAGDVQTVSGVGLDGFGHSTVIHLATPWTVTPNSGDIVIVVLPVNTPEWTTSPVYAKTASAPVVIATPEVSNLAGSTWLIRVRTENAEGVAGPDSVAPFRELYLFGGQGTRTIFASTMQLASDGMILCDTTSGPITCQLLSLAVVPNMRLIIKKVSTDANTVTIFPATGDTVDGNASVVLATYGDFLELKANG